MSPLQGRTALALSLICVTLPISVVPAGAADKAWASCKAANLDRRITGCAEVLARDSRELIERRVVAFYNRGTAYHAKGVVAWT